MRVCLENVYLEVEIEEEGAFPSHFQEESRCDLENLNIAWFLASVNKKYHENMIKGIVR